MDQAFLNLLHERHSFLLTGHEHPDGDCVGAQAALHQLLHALGKTAHVVNSDPINRSHEFLAEDIPFAVHDPRVALPEFEVAVLLDCAQLSRVPALGGRIRESGATIAVVDHHVGSESGDGDVCYVDSEAPSTGTLVYRLYQHFDLVPSLPAARGVFLTLVSDTGWFRYSNTTAEVFRIAAELMALGVDPSAMYDAIHRRNHVDSVEMFAGVLRGHRFSLQGRFAYAALDKAAMDRASRIGYETDSVLDVLRSVEGVEVVALFKERFDGAIKLSLRASHDVDVCAIASDFGGGGHRKAAGAVLQMPLDAAIRTVEAKVEAALGALKGGGA